MGLLDQIDDILEQKDFILPKKNKEDIESLIDECIFSKIADFIFSLNPDNLSDTQIKEVINLIEDLEIEDIHEKGNPSLSNRSSIGKNQASKKWYRENKSRVKRKKEEFLRSKEGRKKLKDKEKNKGKEDRNNKYNTRKRSKRNTDYEKREYGE